MAQSIEGGVIIVNTLSTKNNGDYMLCMAESVGMKDGTSVEQKLSEIEGLNSSITNDEIDGLF